MKYITIVLWSAADGLSYIEDAWRLKVKHWCCSLCVAFDGSNIQNIYLHCITSKLVPLPKVIDAPIQVRNVLSLTVSVKFLNFSSIYTLIFLLKCLLTSCLTLFRLSTLLGLGSCIHCILAHFLWSKKPKHSSSNQGLFCFNSCRPLFR